MNSAPARPTKLSSAQPAKVLTAQHTEIYEMTSSNAVPTVAKGVEKMNARGRCYLLVIAR